ncbi:peptidase M64 [bacterium]|nr:MAG: peptidase M64 [bacterium]
MFDDYFTGQTFRFDYYHSGTAKEEHISLDEIRLEGVWPGSKINLIDESNLGKYMFEVVDLKSNKVIYSRGFASIYGEWETTGEASKVWRTLHESQRFPEPKNKVQLVLKKRQDDGSFTQIYATTIDPSSRFVNRSPLVPAGEVWSVFENGDAAKKVDILILADGYTAKEKDKFHKDVTRLVGVMFETEPFKSQKKNFNVRAIDVFSAQSGISNPRKGVWRKSALGLSFNSFDSDRYVLTYENKSLREISANAPYDAIIMIANDRKYGGGGIFNLWATVTSDTEPSAYVFVHEFGHSFAGLGDEYYTSPVSYENYALPSVEPWEPNVTGLFDPANLKWKHLMEAGTPLPTPWNKDEYDKYEVERQKKRAKMVEEKATEEQMEALFKEVKQVTTPMLQKNKFFGKVGAFEGAAYESKGLYRPELDCIMFTRNDVPFCKVCTESILKVIKMYSE